MTTSNNLECTKLGHCLHTVICEFFVTTWGDEGWGNSRQALKTLTSMQVCLDMAPGRGQRVTTDSDQQQLEPQNNLSQTQFDSW